MKSKFLKQTKSDQMFILITWSILSIFLIAICYPILFVIVSSFSGGSSVMKLSLLPNNVTTIGYRTVFAYKDIWVGYRNSLFYMIAGTSISLFISICCAYPLSRKDFHATKTIMAICIFTMYFSGGMIPTYLQIRNLGLLNSIGAIILPNALSVYNMIVMRTYFKTQIPNELLESAQIDGCGDFLFLIRIALPLSVPVIAVLALFYAVGYWNSYFDALIYLSDRSRFPLTLFLREILIVNTADPVSMGAIDIDSSEVLEARRNVMKYAVIVVASFPVMVLYPFIQRYFVKGIMLGSLKG